MPKLEEIYKRLDSPRFSVRKRGMQELLEAGHREEFVARALADKDKDIVSLAVEWLHPRPPADLLLRCFDLGRQPVPMSAVELMLSHNNYLYAEAEIFAHYGGQGSKMAIGTINAVGAGGLGSFAPVLLKLIKPDLEAASVAYARDGKKAITGGWHRFRKEMVDGAIKPVYTHLESEWSSPSQKVFAALRALHRLGAAIPAADLARLAAQERAMQWPPERESVKPDLLDLVAACGADDAGLRAWLDAVQLPPYWSLTQELGTELLRRRMFEELDRLLAAFEPISFYSTLFCQWPLLDYMERRGLIVIGTQHMARGYLENRRLGVAPPPWWEWMPGQKAGDAGLA